jgi:hypothetical protein
LACAAHALPWHGRWPLGSTGLEFKALPTGVGGLPVERLSLILDAEEALTPKP